VAGANSLLFISVGTYFLYTPRQIISLERQGRHSCNQADQNEGRLSYSQTFCIHLRRESPETMMDVSAIIVLLIYLPVGMEIRIKVKDILALITIVIYPWV